VTINIGTASGKTSAVEIIDLSEGQIAELVEDDEVHPGQMLGDRTPPSAAGLDLQAVDEVNHLVEAAAGTGSIGAASAMMSLAGAGPPIRTALRCWATAWRW
jgi:hypothetical protein